MLGWQGGCLGHQRTMSLVSNGLCRYRALSSGTDASGKQAALAAARARLDQLAAAIGVNHMLSRGAMRHFAQMNVMAGA